MNKILFQHGGLQVREDKLIIGTASIFYDSISTTRIYTGRPLKAAAIVSVITGIPGLLMLLWAKAIFGPYFPSGIVWLIMLPCAGLCLFAFFYKIQTLLISINGRETTIFQAKDIKLLEDAKSAIERAKMQIGSPPSPKTTRSITDDINASIAESIQKRKSGQ